MTSQRGDFCSSLCIMHDNLAVSLLDYLPVGIKITHNALYLMLLSQKIIITNIWEDSPGVSRSKLWTCNMPGAYRPRTLKLRFRFENVGSTLCFFKANSEWPIKTIYRWRVKLHCNAFARLLIISAGIATCTIAHQRSSTLSVLERIAAKGF